MKKSVELEGYELQESESENVNSFDKGRSIHIIRIKNSFVDSHLFLPEGITLSPEAEKTAITVSSNVSKNVLIIYEIDVRKNVSEELIFVVKNAMVRLHIIFSSKKDNVSQNNASENDNLQNDKLENDKLLNNTSQKDESLNHSYDLKTTIHAEKGSLVFLTSVQDTSPFESVTKTTTMNIQELASISETALILASGNVIEKTTIFLEGPFAKVTRKEGSICTQKIEQENTLHHLSQNTTAQIESKSLVEAKGFWQQKSIIQAGTIAKNTVSFIRADALLLDKNAKALAIPALEIEAEDVQIGHASSVSHINSDTLFYLQTRGLTKDEARESIKKGFLQTYFADFPKEILKEK